MKYALLAEQLAGDALSSANEAEALNAVGLKAEAERVLGEAAGLARAAAALTALTDTFRELIEGVQK